MGPRRRALGVSRVTLLELDQWLEHWGRAHRAEEPRHLKPGEDAPAKISGIWRFWRAWRDPEFADCAPPPREVPPNPEWVRAIEWAMEVDPLTGCGRLQKRHRRWLTKWYVHKRGDVLEECRVAAMVALQYLLTEKYL